MNAVAILLETLPAHWGVTVKHATLASGTWMEYYWLNAGDARDIAAARNIRGMASVQVNPPWTHIPF